MRKFALWALKPFIKSALRRRIKRGRVNIQLPDGTILFRGQNEYTGPVIEFDNWGDLFSLAINEFSTLADALAASQVHFKGHFPTFEMLVEDFVPWRQWLYPGILGDHLWHVSHSYYDGEFLGLEDDVIQAMGPDDFANALENHFVYQVEITEAKGIEFWWKRYFYLMFTKVALRQGYLTAEQLQPNAGRGLGLEWPGIPTIPI